MGAGESVEDDLVASIDGNALITKNPYHWQQSDDGYYAFVDLGKNFALVRKMQSDEFNSGVVDLSEVSRLLFGLWDSLRQNDADDTDADIVRVEVLDSDKDDVNDPKPDVQTETGDAATDNLQMADGKNVQKQTDEQSETGDTVAGNSQVADGNTVQTENVEQMEESDAQSIASQTAHSGAHSYVRSSAKSGGSVQVLNANTVVSDNCNCRQLSEDLAKEKRVAAALREDLQSAEQRHSETQKTGRFWFVAAIVSGCSLLLTAVFCALLCLKLRKARGQNCVALQSEGLEVAESRRIVRLPKATVEMQRLAIDHATDDELFPRRGAVRRVEFEDGSSEQLYEMGPEYDTCTVQTPVGEL